MTDDELRGRMAAYERLLTQTVALALIAHGADDAERLATPAARFTANLAAGLESQGLGARQLMHADRAGARVMDAIVLAIAAPPSDAMRH